MDKRNPKRHVFAVMVNYSNEEKDLFAYCRNVSEGGLFINTLLPLAIGTEIVIKFKFPYDLSEFETKARVQWIRKSKSQDHEAGMGLTFIDLLEGDRELLKEHLKFYQERD